jgi:tetraacyldisaccharide 4'-kinase
MKTETYTSSRQWFYRILNSGEPKGLWKIFFFPLYFLSLVFLYAVKIRAYLYKIRVLRAGILPKRVISVGNLTVGGTGKTPTVLALARFFQEQGLQVAILSRGYKRSGTARNLLVSNGREILVSPSEAGEEAYFLARELKGVIVAVGKNRYLTGLFLLKKFKIDLFILDDGFQHLKLRRDTDILLLNHDKPFGNGFLLPRGELREPLSALKRASLILWTRKEMVFDKADPFSNPLKFDMIPSHSVFFVPDCFMDMETQEHYSPESLGGKSVLLVSGIGNPKSFTKLIEQCGIQVVRELIFPDHHPYPSDDIDAIYDIARSRKVDFIITTDKDAVKLAPHLRNEIPMITLKLKMITGEDFPWEELKNGTI